MVSRMARIVKKCSKLVAHYQVPTTIAFASRQTKDWSSVTCVFKPQQLHACDDLHSYACMLASQPI